MTAQEIHILELLAAGCRRGQVAAQLNMSRRAVRRQIKDMLQRNGLNTPEQLMSLAATARIVRPAPPAHALELLTGRRSDGAET